MSISFSWTWSSLVKGSLHRPRGGGEINEDMPDLAPLQRTRNQEACSPPPPAATAAARSTVRFVARIVEVSHLPEIKQAIIHILFGEGKIKVNLSFCSSWSSFGLGSLLSTWWRLCWLAGFFIFVFCFDDLSCWLDYLRDSLVWCRLLLGVKCNDAHHCPFANVDISVTMQ